MTNTSLNSSITKSLLLLLFVSIFQPYIVLISKYDSSAACMDCSILEQTFIPSILFLALPLTLIYLATRYLAVHPIIQSLLLTIYFSLVSFVKLTIPLFDDRIAAWSTYSDEEVWLTAMLMAFLPLLALSTIIGLLLVLFNRKRNQS